MLSSIFIQILLLMTFSNCFLTEARNCLCVHDGFVLPVDQHPTVTEISGGTCVQILNEHVHFKNVNWTLVIYQDHHAFVEKIRTEYDKLECDENNIPLTTKPTSPSTTETTTTTISKPRTTPLPTTVITQQQTTASPTVKPYCPPKTGAPQNTIFSCPGVDFIPRVDWGASTQYEALNDLTKQFSCTVNFVVIHQTLGGVCHTKSDCISRVQTDIQHWKTRQFNFAIGNDGTIFELNGFHSVGKHANFFDNISLGIAFIGDYTSVKPSQVAMESLQKFLACMLEEQLLHPSYVIRTERDVLGTGLGDALYYEVENLPHY